MNTWEQMLKKYIRLNAKMQENGMFGMSLIERKELDFLEDKFRAAMEILEKVAPCSNFLGREKKRKKMKYENPLKGITWEEYYESLKKMETEDIEVYIKIVEAAPSQLESMKSVLKELRELIAERKKKE